MPFLSDFIHSSIVELKPLLIPLRNSYIMSSMITPKMHHNPQKIIGNSILIASLITKPLIFRKKQIKKILTHQLINFLRGTLSSSSASRDKGPSRSASDAEPSRRGTYRSWCPSLHVFISCTFRICIHRIVFQERKILRSIHQGKKHSRLIGICQERDRMTQRCFCNSCILLY